MEELLAPEEVRVLGVLMEKQMTTPEYYPMTVNAVKNACNQKTNRHPGVEFEEDFVSDIIDRLRRKRVLIVVSGPGMRARKYEHNLKDLLFLNQKEMALLCMLMLRGPQTVGELRGRSERMASFEGLEEVEEVLGDLAAANRQPLPLVRKLPVLPGQKEHRFVHLLSGEPDLERLAIEAEFDAPVSSRSSSADKLAELEAQVETLSRELSELREAFEQFKQQFE